MLTEIFMRILPSLSAAACVLALTPIPGLAESADDGSAYQAHATAVYVATNATAGNAIVAYRAAKSGLLTSFATYPTGGAGVGPNKVPALTPGAVDPLGSNASIRYVSGRGILLVVNAGSATISSFSIKSDDSLIAGNSVPSGGTFPTSIAALGRLVYVANVGDPAKGTPATISGFDLAPNGHLTPIPNSTRTLSQPTTSQATTAVFSPGGQFLVVTDTTADRVTTFAVRGDGRLGDPISTPSAGAGPFAAIFHRGTLLVQETQSGVPGATSLTSYRLLPDGHVVPLAASIPSGETAGCWITTRGDVPLIYVADTGSGTISSYIQRFDGSLSLAVAAAAPVVPTSGPIDLGLSRDGEYLYQLYGALGKIGVYKTAPDGSLSYIGNAGGLPPAGTQGIVVY
jgi:6-phosphogluconolactonase (cycloisomerase 2 family)